MKEFKSGDIVDVSIRRHLFIRRNNELIEKSNMTTTGIFIDYVNDGKSGRVRIVTIEGERIRSFPLSQLCLKEKINA